MRMNSINTPVRLIRILSFAMLFMTLTTMTACARDDNEADSESQILQNDNSNMNSTLKLTIGQTSFTATLEDNATVKELQSLLPMTLQMDELNGNEKYCYLSSSLPTAASRPGTIHAGDIMLYGSSCIVIFYKTFSSGYSYTRIGHIDNVEQLAQAVGSGSVSVRFEMQPTTGIGSAKMSAHSTDGARYTLNGQKVSDNYKGIYIRDGKKYRK